MDNVVSLLLSQGTITLAVAVFVLTFFVRRICEMQWPGLKMAAGENDPAKSYPTKMSEWWNKVILYAIPVVIGALIALFRIPFVFPEDTFETTGGRVVFGVLVGWFSSYLYKIIKAAIGKKAGVTLSDMEG